MVNHFRTLLLNLADQGEDSEHIAPGFNPAQMPPLLQGFYDLLFPRGTTRENKQFVAYNLLMLIKACGLDDALTKHDSRITYRDTDDHFKIARISYPIASSPAFPLFVFGRYRVINGKNTDRILIQQNADSPSQVSVFSYAHAKYIVGSEFSTDRQFVDVNFVDPFVCNTVHLPVVGLRFNIGSVGGQTEQTINYLVTDAGDQIVLENLLPLAQEMSGLLSGTFTDNPTKVWEFLVDVPNEFDAKALYTRVSTSTLTDKVLSLPCKTDTTKYENLWRFHPNYVYRLAGLLVSFVYRLNDL